MARQIQLRQGTTVEHNTFTGALGEITYDTNKKVVVTHDGVTVGGNPNAARANADGTISLIKKDGGISGTISASGLFNNTLTSTDTNQALTAAQGKVLADTKLATTSAFGVGQSWVSVSRANNTNYWNDTGKPICVAAGAYGRDATITIYVNGVMVHYSTDIYDSSANHASGMAIVPIGAYYLISATWKISGGFSFVSELR